jgi:hypothetical protein
MTEHGRVTHHGTGNISVGNSGTQTQGDRSSIWAPPEGTAARESEVAPAETLSADPDKTRNVFIVHGRDQQVTEAMFDLLRTLDLVPLEWEQLVAATGHAGNDSASPSAKARCPGRTKETMRRAPLVATDEQPVRDGWQCIYPYSFRPGG